MTGRFLEVYSPYRSSLYRRGADKAGEAIFEGWNTALFQDVEGGTMVTIDVHVITASEVAPRHLKGMTHGWNRCPESERPLGIESRNT